MNNKINKPPRAATRLLHAFLRRDFIEDVTSDLQEQYDEALLLKGKFKAQINYWYQVINYLRPFAIKNIKYHYVNPFPMYKSYFKTAVRGMIKNKLHAFINISGLSVGMAVFISIGLWIVDEISFDKNFKKYEKIGKVIQNVTNNGEIQTWGTVPFPLAEELRKNYGDDFKHVVVTSGPRPQLLSTETKRLNKNGLFAESEFTKIFDLRMLHGRQDALNESASIIVDMSTALAYFGETDVVGQVMTIDRRFTVKVSGVYEDLPPNSSFSGMNFIARWDIIENDLKNISDPWRPNSFDVYAELVPNTTFESASGRIRDAKLKRVNEFLAKKKPELFIHPMSKWHLYEKFENGKQAGGRIQYVWMFGIIGAFVLLMACINFMNLSTAQSERRAKEVGIRKVVGSFRHQLIGQFFCESIFTAFISVIFALLIVQLALPTFNEIAGKDINLEWTSMRLWSAGLIFSILIGLVAGSYPALYLSSIRALSAIKGGFKAGKAAAIPRKVLVTLQFTVSVILIVGTVTVFLQIQHAKDRPLGYESNGLVAVPTWSTALHDHFDAVRTELESAGAIISLAESGSSTTESWSSSSGFDWKGKDPDLSVDFANVGISQDYGKTIGWEIIAGRDFSRDFPSDSSALIINEAAVKFMGLKNPIGEIVRWNGEPLTVIGVVKDIVIRSPYAVANPNVYFLSRGAETFLIMRINPKSTITDAVSKIETVYKKFDPEVPFSYEFIDKAYARKFESEERIGKLATIFSTLAIIISCLGIFGLSSFVAEQRTKELGIRKVMGASLLELWSMMSRDFVLLVILSGAIATPIAYKSLSGWLDGYAYRIAMPLWTFVAAITVTLAITLLTISWHTLQAAHKNPTTSLRSE